MQYIDPFRREQTNAPYGNYQAIGNFGMYISLDIYLDMFSVHMSTVFNSNVQKLNLSIIWNNNNNKFVTIERIIAFWWYFEIAHSTKTMCEFQLQMPYEME